MLFYTNNLNTNSTVDNNQVFSKEDFKRVYNNCYEIDVRKGENVSKHGSKNSSLIKNEQLDNLGKNNNEKTNNLKDNSLHKKNNSFTLLSHDSLINDKENLDEKSNELNNSDDKIGEVYIDSYNKKNKNNNNNNEDEESSSFIIYNDDE